MKEIVAAIVLAGTLSACSTVDNAAEVVAQKGAQAADRALQAAEWQLCKATTMGALTRRYGSSAERLRSYVTFCYPGSERSATNGLPQSDAQTEEQAPLLENRLQGSPQERTGEHGA